MGNVVNNSINGKRYATGYPKKPKPHKCRTCLELLGEAPFRMIGGKRYHLECRKGQT